ncbi:MAG: hypothetical protein V3V81_07605 [Candidatus Bathyarchaeia archaeon]
MTLEESEAEIAAIRARMHKRVEAGVEDEETEAIYVETIEFIDKRWQKSGAEIMMMIAQQNRTAANLKSNQGDYYGK